MQRYRVLIFHPNPSLDLKEKYEINGILYSGWPKVERHVFFDLAWEEAISWGTPLRLMSSEVLSYAFLEAITDYETPLFRGHPIGAVVSNSFTTANGHTEFQTKKYRFDQGDQLPTVRRTYRRHNNIVDNFLLMSPR